jgi:hypothetical protein
MENIKPLNANPVYYFIIKLSKSTKNLFDAHH